MYPTTTDEYVVGRGAGVVHVERGLDHSRRFTSNSKKRARRMSDVTRNTHDGSNDGVGGRPDGVLGRMDSGEGVRPDGCRQGSVLAGGVERLASRTVARDRVAELEDAAGYRGGDARGETKLFAWWGTQASLTSELASDRIALINHLTSICRAERQRGLAGHWTYDKARHDQIAHILACEESELQDIMEATNAV